VGEVEPGVDDRHRLSGSRRRHAVGADRRQPPRARDRQDEPRGDAAYAHAAMVAPPASGDNRAGVRSGIAPVLGSSGGTALDVVLVLAIALPALVFAGVCWIFWRAKRQEDRARERAP
jgi:hypothetical protein